MASTFLYFAYGSNMLTRRLRAPNRAPSAALEGIGFVERRRLTFDKVSRDGSGKCDIEATNSSTDRVHGVLFSIAASEENALDREEGVGNGYRKAKIQVVTANGEMVALACIATKKNPGSRPYHWYKALVIAGAVEHGLPVPYIEWLRTVDSQPDPQASRQAQNEALFSFEG
jgi:gamma-glutamylcyclotransferase